MKESSQHSLQKAVQERHWPSSKSAAANPFTRCCRSCCCNQLSRRATASGSCLLVTSAPRPLW